MDTWTTSQMVYSFACMLGSFIDDDWNLIEHVVDFKVLENKEHEGLYGGKVFVGSACRIGCFNKICLCICLDTGINLQSDRTITAVQL